jgi:hypothetical protein
MPLLNGLNLLKYSREQSLGISIASSGTMKSGAAAITAGVAGRLGK